MTNSSDRLEYFRQYRQRHKNDEKYKADARARGKKYRKLHAPRNRGQGDESGADWQVK